jgi:hypothetical protein
MDLMGIVTDLPEWRPLLDAVAIEGIGRDCVIIKHRTLLDEGRPGHFKKTGDIDIEIRHPSTWTMDSEKRCGLEGRLRSAADPRWNGPGMKFHWRRPVPMEAVDVSLNAVDALWQDWNRRRIDDEAFKIAQQKLSDLHKRIWDDGEDWEPLAAEYGEILAEARLHPQPAKPLPPLPEGTVGVDEVMTVLRAIASGELVPKILTPAKWIDVHHTIGVFEAGGWRLEAFRRSSGMKYVQAVTAPDGRIGKFEDFEAREGDPFCLLEDDEQDLVCAVLDAMQYRP